MPTGRARLRPPVPVPRPQFAMASASLRLQIPIAHWAVGSLNPPQAALTSAPRAQFEMVSASLRSHTPISHWAAGSLYPALRALASAPHRSHLRLLRKATMGFLRKSHKVFSSVDSDSSRYEIVSADFQHSTAKPLNADIMQGSSPAPPRLYYLPML